MIFILQVALGCYKSLLAVVGCPKLQCDSKGPPQFIFTIRYKIPTFSSTFSKMGFFQLRSPITVDVRCCMTLIAAVSCTVLLYVVVR